MKFHLNYVVKALFGRGVRDINIHIDNKYPDKKKSVIDFSFKYQGSIYRIIRDELKEVCYLMKDNTLLRELPDYHIERAFYILEADYLEGGKDEKR